LCRVRFIALPRAAFTAPGPYRSAPFGNAGASVSAGARNA